MNTPDNSKRFDGTPDDDADRSIPAPANEADGIELSAWGQRFVVAEERRQLAVAYRLVSRMVAEGRMLRMMGKILGEAEMARQVVKMGWDTGGDMSRCVLAGIAFADFGTPAGNLCRAKWREHRACAAKLAGLWVDSQTDAIMEWHGDAVGDEELSGGEA